MPITQTRVQRRQMTASQWSAFTLFKHELTRITPPTHDPQDKGQLSWSQGAFLEQEALPWQPQPIEETHRCDVFHTAGKQGWRLQANMKNHLWILKNTQNVYMKMTFIGKGRQDSWRSSWLSLNIKWSFAASLITPLCGTILWLYKWLRVIFCLQLDHRMISVVCMEFYLLHGQLSTDAYTLTSYTVQAKWWYTPSHLSNFHFLK